MTIGYYIAELLYNSKLIVELCFYSLREEIQQTKRDNLLFRTDSMCTRMITTTMHKLGKKYLKKVLVPIIKLIDNYQLPIEIDEVFIDNKNEDVQKNVENLMQICSNVLEKFINSIRKLSPIVCYILIECKNQVAEFFPNCALRAISAFLFFRFIFPVLTVPEKFDLVTSCDKQLRRKLIIISKILQSIFNENVPYEEQWMNPILPFIIKNITANQRVYVMLEQTIEKTQKKNTPLFSKHFTKSSSSPGLLDHQMEFILKIEEYCQLYIDELLEFKSINFWNIESATKRRIEIFDENDNQTMIINQNTLDMESSSFINWLKFLSIQPSLRTQPSSSAYSSPKQLSQSVGGADSAPTLSKPVTPRYFSPCNSPTSNSLPMSFISTPLSISILELITKFLISKSPTPAMFIYESKQEICFNTLSLLDEIIWFVCFFFKNHFF